MNISIITSTARMPAFWLIVFWPCLLLADFLPTFGFPTSTLGYHWNVEFALAALILVALLLTLGSHSSNSAKATVQRNHFLFIILPLVAFSILSGLSMMWAVNTRNALHHTLLWGCYLFFFVLILQALSTVDALSISLKITGIVIVIFGLSCISEYIGSVKPITHAFTIRWYKNAEVATTLLPPFIALSFSRNPRTAILSGTVSLAAWLVVLMSLSRTMFVASAVTLTLFLALVVIDRGSKHIRKRAAILAGLLLVLVAATQISSSLMAVEGGTLKRFGNDESSRTSAASRLLFWGIALESFREHPLLGVGADNYISIYRDGRESFSERYPGNKILEINEDIIPERAHNEYLQILCELGIFGSLVFAWFLFGIIYLVFASRSRRISILSIGSYAGMAAFLISSFFSSYSFRVPANGMCFFFLLAVAVRGLPNSKSADSLGSKSLQLKPGFIIAGVVLSLTMIAFSLVRVLTLRHLANFQNASDRVYAESEIKKAIALDPSEPMFRFYYGQQLYLSNKYDEAIPQIRQANETGLGTSASYFNLAAAQMLSGKNDDAIRTFDEALRVYPRSVFLRTAIASFLKRTGNTNRAAAEYSSALAINEKQARSWQLAHEQGLERLVQIARVDTNYLSPFDLKPESAPLVLSNFQKMLLGGVNAK